MEQGGGRRVAAGGSGGGPWQRGLPDAADADGGCAQFASHWVIQRPAAPPRRAVVAAKCGHRSPGRRLGVAASALAIYTAFTECVEHLQGGKGATSPGMRRVTGAPASWGVAWRLQALKSMQTNARAYVHTVRHRAQDFPAWGRCLVVSRGRRGARRLDPAVSHHPCAASGRTAPPPCSSAASAGPSGRRRQRRRRRPQPAARPWCRRSRRCWAAASQRLAF